jgi:hypothetical protein
MKVAKLITFYFWVLLTTGSPLASGQTSASIPAKPVLAIDPNTSTVKLVIPGTTNPSIVKCQVLDVPAKVALRSEDGSIPILVAIQDPISKKSYIMPSFGNYWVAVHDPATKVNQIVSEAAFYVSRDSGIIAFILTPGGGLEWRGSYYEMSESAGNLDAAIAQFRNEKFDEVMSKELQKKSSAVFLRDAAPLYFFEATPGSSQPGDATISAIDVTDGILRLDLLSPGGEFKGSFWVDLSARKLVRAIVDGQEMDLSKPGGFGVPKNT